MIPLYRPLRFRLIHLDLVLLRLPPERRDRRSFPQESLKFSAGLAQRSVIDSARLTRLEASHRAVVRLLSATTISAVCATAHPAALHRRATSPSAQPPRRDRHHHKGMQHHERPDGRQDDGQRWV